MTSVEASAEIFADSAKSPNAKKNSESADEVVNAAVVESAPVTVSAPSPTVAVPAGVIAVSPLVSKTVSVPTAAVVEPAVAASEPEPVPVAAPEEVPSVEAPASDSATNEPVPQAKKANHRKRQPRARKAKAAAATAPDAAASDATAGPDLSPVPAVTSVETTPVKDATADVTTQSGASSTEGGSASKSKSKFPRRKKFSKSSNAKKNSESADEDYLSLYNLIISLENGTARFPNVFTRPMAPDTRPSIFVDNLSPDIDDEILHAAFITDYPSVASAKVITEDGQSKGYGFVSFEDPFDYNNALTIRKRMVGTTPVAIFRARQNNGGGRGGGPDGQKNPRYSGDGGGRGGPSGGDMRGGPSSQPN